MFEYIKGIASKIDAKIAESGTLVPDSGLHDYNWFNRIYTSEKYARAHVEVLDRTEQNNMWIMHTVITPHVTCPDPIFGFDIVVTSKKVSGIFHDFTPVIANDTSKLMTYFAKVMPGVGEGFGKVRELPDWGKQLFSPHMLAVGAINDGVDASNVCEFCFANLEYYLSHVGDNNQPRMKRMIIEGQNKYARLQKQNPYPVRMLMKFGLTEELAVRFVDKYLFPEITK